MSNEVRQYTVAPDDDGIRLDRWFKRHLPQIGFGMVSNWARVLGAASPPGGTRRTCPAVSRSSGFTRLPSTRTCPVRAHFETMPKPICGKWRLNQRSSRTPSSSGCTVNWRTLSDVLIR